MKIAFLLGSGISLKAGLLNVNEITNKILIGEGISHHATGYYFIPPPYSHFNIPCYNMKRILVFINFIKDKLDIYYKKYDELHLTNYEDIFFILRQLHDEIYGEHENLIVSDFLNDLHIDNETMLEVKDKRFYNDFKIGELIWESMIYINNTVSRLLYNPNKDYNYLNMFCEISRDKEIKRTDIFCLNHDRLLELYFDMHKIKYCDGFDEQEGDIKPFNIKLFNNKNRINLYKLHGSIDWFRYRVAGMDWRGDFIVKPMISDVQHLKDKNGNYLDPPLENTTKILIGTFNKIIDYNSGIFFDLFSLFVTILDNHNYLIISGYGFGDKGINTKIIEWYYKNPKRKIIVIHKKPNDLKSRSRGAIYGKWKKWIKEGRLIIIEEWFEISWNEIQSMLYSDKLGKMKKED